MILKLVYILFFAASNFVIYALIHKKGLIKRNLLITSIAIYTIVFVLHAILGNNGILLPAHSFFISTFFLATPVIVYLWFNFLALKRMNRLKEKGVNENFVNTAIKVFSVFFLNAPFVMAFVMQCVAVLTLN